MLWHFYCKLDPTLAYFHLKTPKTLTQTHSVDVSAHHKLDRRVKKCLFAAAEHNLFMKINNTTTSRRRWAIVIIKFMRTVCLMSFMFAFFGLSFSHVSESIKAKKLEHLIWLGIRQCKNEKKKLLRHSLWCVVSAERVKIIVFSASKWWTTNTFLAAVGARQLLLLHSKISHFNFLLFYVRVDQK